MADLENGPQSIVPTDSSELRLALMASERAVRTTFRKFSRLRRKAKYRLGWLSPPRLDMYIGMGRPDWAEVRGRALEDPPLAAPAVEDSQWDNFRRSFRLFETDELADLEIEVRIGKDTKVCTTDAVGFFRTELELTEPLHPGFNTFTAQPLGHESAEPIDGRIYVPSPQARFGVISDIDDTILQTHVRNLAKMVWVTLIGNALTRLSFDGAPRLYQGLRAAGNDAPFFYVSRSAWNVHYLLEHFIRHRGFPEGPLALRDAGMITPPAELRGSKRKEAERILARYSPLPFVLIGDSGERDALIYSELSRMYPDRVLAILIRQVTSPRRVERTRALLESHRNCPSLVFRDDAEAVDWCKQHGLWATPS